MTTLYIQENLKKGTIAPEIYGHFAEHLGRCIYEGLYVGENDQIPNVNGMRVDAVAALKELRVPVLRWPGGCFADEYHWQDGIGPREKRKKMINTHWGGVLEDNSFGTHEYMELCHQIGCKTYVNGNLGSGTVREMSEWVEYMTFPGVSPMADERRKNGHDEPWRVDYFGVGNENWGCGGNMTPEFYANEYRRYQTYVRDYSKTHHIRKVCCGPNVDDYEWTEGVMKTCFTHSPEEAHGLMDFLSLHYYVHPEGWTKKGSATEFDEGTWYKSLKKALYMDELVRRHSEIMDRYDPKKHIGLSVDEWGAWYTCEPGTNPGFLYQQNTVRDALIAAITLNIFNEHCDRVRMACLAQMVNVLQAVLLTEGEKLILTPTYHVMHMFRHHQGATLVGSELVGDKTVGKGIWSVPQITQSVSRSADGTLNVTLGNLSATEDAPMTLVFSDDHRVTEARIVTGEAIQTYNSFDEPCAVEERDFSGWKADGKELALTLPPHSVVMIRLK